MKQLRKIKFRAWHLHENKMYDVYNLDLLFGRCWSKERRECLLGCDIELMQYTGLKDKNGKEIFEGDIVEVEAQCIGGRDFKGVVKFYDCSFFIDNGEDVILLFDEVDPRIVLGNIYEHPELLGVPND